MDIFVLKDGQQRGPYGVDSLRIEVSQGRYSPSDPAWYQGIEDWKPVSELLATLSHDATPQGSPPAFPSREVVDSEAAKAGMLIRKNGTVATWTPKDILAALKSGGLLPDDECWNPEWSQWVPLSGIPEVAKAAGIPYVEVSRDVLPNPLGVFQHPDFGQIRDTDHALRMIKFTAWFYYGLAALDTLLALIDTGFLVFAIIILPLALLLHLKRSRKAALGLLLIALLAAFATVMSLGDLPGGAILFVGIVTLLQVYLSVQALRSTTFLKRPNIQQAA